MICNVHHRPMRQIGESLICPACLGDASAPAVAGLEERAERQEQRDTAKRLEQAGVPAKFADSSFENWNPTTERATRMAKVMGKYVQEFASSRRKRDGFIFTGAPGTGKTHIACAIVSGLARGGFNSRYLSVPTFTRAVKASYGRPGQTDLLLRSVIDSDFLVMDEIDLHGSSDVDYTILYDIINSRYERSGAPVLVISNRPVDRLIVDLDGRIVSRILGAHPPMIFDWPSQREVRLSQRRFSLEGRPA